MPNIWEQIKKLLGSREDAEQLLLQSMAAQGDPTAVGMQIAQPPVITDADVQAILERGSPPKKK